MKKLPPQETVVRLADFVLFMESNELISYTLSTPFFPIFDYKLISGEKVSVKDTGKGPFRMSNEFMDAHFERGAEYGEQVLELSEAMCKMNMKFANVPLYMLQCFMGYVASFDGDFEDLFLFYQGYRKYRECDATENFVRSRLKEYKEYYQNDNRYFLKDKA